VLLASQFPVRAFIVLWLLFVGAAAIGWLVVYPYMLRQGPLARYRDGVFAGPRRWESLAGLRAPLPRFGTVTVTPPLARLTCDEDGIHVQPAVGILGILVPRLMFKWEDMRKAEVVGDSALRLQFRAVDAPIILGGLTDRSSLIDEIAAHGIEVDRHGGHTSWWSTR
jgi:hypothetical protein